MTALTLPAVDAQAVAARYLGPARAYIRAMHGDETLTYGQVEEQALRCADMPALRAAVDEARVDAVAELDVLRTRFANLVKRAEQIDPKDAGRVCAFLRDDLALTLTSSRDDEHDQRREAMASGRHPAGKALRPLVLDDFNE